MKKILCSCGNKISANIYDKHQHSTYHHRCCSQGLKQGRPSGWHPPKLENVERYANGRIKYKRKPKPKHIKPIEQIPQLPFVKFRNGKFIIPIGDLRMI